jgi:hypothetical protein
MEGEWTGSTPDIQAVSAMVMRVAWMAQNGGGEAGDILSVLVENG